MRHRTKKLLCSSVPGGSRVLLLRAFIQAIDPVCGISVGLLPGMLYMTVPQAAAPPCSLQPGRGDGLMSLKKRWQRVLSS